MNWRTYIYQTLIASSVTAIVPEGSMFGAGAVTGAPGDKPFIVLRFMPDVRNPIQGTDGEVVFWVHDEPGDYTRIDEVLALIKAVFDNRQVSEPGAHCVRWTGTSQDLVDDGYNTICRNASYRLIGS